MVFNHPNHPESPNQNMRYHTISTPPCQPLPCGSRNTSKVANHNPAISWIHAGCVPSWHGSDWRNPPERLQHFAPCDVRKALVDFSLSACGHRQGHRRALSISMAAERMPLFIPQRCPNMYRHAPDISSAPPPSFGIPRTCPQRIRSWPVQAGSRPWDGRRRGTSRARFLPR